MQFYSSSAHRNANMFSLSFLYITHTALCGDDCFYMLGRLTVKTDSEQNPSCSMASVLKVFFAEMATFPGAVSVKLTDNFAEDFDCATDDDDEEEEDSSSVADASRTSGERTSATSDKETPSVAGLASISMAAGALVAVAMVGVYLQRRRQQQQEEHRVRVARMGAAPSLMDVESSMYD